MPSEPSGKQQENTLKNNTKENWALKRKARNKATRQRRITIKENRRVIRVGANDRTKQFKFGAIGKPRKMYFVLGKSNHVFDFLT